MSKKIFTSFVFINTLYLTKCETITFSEKEKTLFYGSDGIVKKDNIYELTIGTHTGVKNLKNALKNVFSSINLKINSISVLISEDGKEKIITEEADDADFCFSTKTKKNKKMYI